MRISLLADARPWQVIVKTYARGSFLGLLGPLIAFFMAQRGMNGWQTSAFREMEQDAVELASQGYRIASTEEFGIPLLGIVSYKVTFELIGPQRNDAV